MMTQELKEFDRKRKQQFHKNPRSKKWDTLNAKFEEKSGLAKSNFYKKNMIEDLKISNPAHWYSKFKRMSSHDQHREETVNVEEIIGMDDQRQADVIADKFEITASRYSPIHSEQPAI